MVKVDRRGKKTAALGVVRVTQFPPRGNEQSESGQLTEKFGG